MKNENRNNNTNGATNNSTDKLIRSVAESMTNATEEIREFCDKVCAIIALDSYRKSESKNLPKYNEFVEFEMKKITENLLNTISVSLDKISLDVIKHVKGEDKND